MKITRRDIKVQNMTRTFAVRATDREKSTMEVIWTAGTAVKRFGYIDGDWQYFEETLSLKPRHLRLDGMAKKGVPFLDSHRTHGSLKDGTVMGRLFHKSFEGDKAIGEVRWSQRADVQEVRADYEDGTLTDVSVGYVVRKYKDVTEKDATIKRFEAVDWTPKEVSGVAIGADPEAVSRSEDTGDDNIFECEVFRHEESDSAEAVVVTEDPKTIEPTAALVEDNTLNNNRAEEISMDPVEQKRLEEEAKVEKIRLQKEAKLEEKTRTAAIIDACKKAQMAEEFSARMIEEDKNIDEVRALIIEDIAVRDDNTSTSAANIEVGANITRESTMTGIEAALMHRHDPKNAHDDNSKRFARMDMVDMARASLIAGGARNVEFMGKHEIVKEAIRGAGHNSSSDFPVILENVMNKTLLRGYEDAPATWQPFSRETTVNDFKEVSKVGLGEFSQLDPVNEGGEYTSGKIGERGEKYKISKFGKKIALTWEMLMNDDISAFTTIPARMGKKARDLESDKVWAVMLANTQVMAEDNEVLFSNAHNNLNLGGAGAVSETTLAAMREAMRLQQDLDGTSPKNLFASHIYVPASREVETLKILRSITPNQSSQVNLFGQDAGFSLTPLVEPRLDAAAGKPWFTSSDLNSVDMMEVARLAGEESPSVTSREGFDVDGIEYKIRHLFVAHAIDFRGLQRNNGA